jgi:AcrR family transcriptional regulator
MAKAVDMGDGREVRRSANGKPVLASNRPNKFGVKVRKAFLTHLSGCCNVRASAKAAGCSIGAVYYWRGADAEFAAAFDAALEAGYLQLEHLLIERAQRGDKANALDIADYDAMPDPSKVDTELAMKLMSLHHQGVKRGGKRGGGAARSKATREETDAAIIKRLKVLRIRFEHGED